VQATNPGVGTTTFKYDPFGRRIQKSGPLGTTNYLYDGENLIEETNSSGGVVAKYTGENEIDEPLAEVRQAGPPLFRTDRTTITEVAPPFVIFERWGFVCSGRRASQDPLRVCGYIAAQLWWGAPFERVRRE
jgi:YD repeat-containing protein